MQTSYKKYTPQETADLMLTSQLMQLEFPVDKVPEEFVKDLNTAMRYASAGGFRQQGFDRGLYSKFRNWLPPFSCTEMRLAIKLVECLTPNELMCEDEAEYDETQNRVDALMQIYNELKEPIAEKIKREINAKEKISLNAPIGHQIFKK